MLECEYIIITWLGVESNSGRTTVLLIGSLLFFWLNPGLSSLPGSRVAAALAGTRDLSVKHPTRYRLWWSEHGKCYSLVMQHRENTELSTWDKFQFVKV